MDLEKAHKYIRRWKMNNGEWGYEYPQKHNNKNYSFKDVITKLVNKTTEIKDIKPLTTEEEIDTEIKRLTKLSEKGKLRCPALGNNNIYIEEMTTEHAKKTYGVYRTNEARIHKLQYLSFVEPVLKNGVLFMKSRKYNHSWSLDKVPERERTTYGIINKVTYFDNKKNKQITCGMEIVVAWDNKRKMFVFSFIDRQIKKSLLLNKDLNKASFEVSQVGASKKEAFTTTNYIIPQQENMSRKKSQRGNNMDFYFTKSVKAISLSMVKSMDFKQLKARLINHLKKQMKKEETKEFSKSLAVFEIMQKAAFPVGTIREWKGKKYIKTAPGKWMRKYDKSGGRGFNRALKNVMRKMEAAETPEELYAIIMQNASRFRDENGKMLPEVQQLHDLSQKKQGEKENKGNQGKISPKKDTLEDKKESKTEEKNIATKGKFATDKQIDYVTEISNKKTFNREKMLTKPVVTVQKYANSRVEDFKGSIDEFIEYMADRQDGISLDEIGKEWSKLINHNVARKIFEDYKNKNLVINDDGYFVENKTEEKQGKLPSGYVTDLSIEKQGELNKLLKEHFKNEGMSGMDIADAVDNAMDSKISDLEEIYNKNKKVKEFLMNVDSDSSSFKLSDIYDRNVHDEMKKVQSFDEAKNVIKQIADNYGPTEKGRKLLENFMSYNVGGSSPIYDKVYEHFGISYNDLDADFDAAKDKILKLASGKKDVTKEDKKIQQGKDDFEQKYREGLENEDKNFQKQNSETQKEISDTINSYYDEMLEWTDWRTTSQIKKYGEKRLQELVSKIDRDIDGFKNRLIQKATEELEKNPDKKDEIISAVKDAVYTKAYYINLSKKAEKKLDTMQKNKMDDLPVDPKDKQEAISIIGSDVNRILTGSDPYGNAKQTLADKIKRRFRNNPGVCRAMLVYIREKQKESGKTIFTEKNSIWNLLPKLNENAKESQAKGESETKTGVSGNIYSGDDGTTIVENKDWGRYQIALPGKPNRETITKLKQNGFRWSPSTKTWVGYNTANGERKMHEVAEFLGLKKEVQKSITSKVKDIFYGGNF